MFIRDLLKNDGVISFEIFPPNKKLGYDSVKNAVDELAVLSPSFISVTCGAAGGGVSEKMIEISSHIQNVLNITALAHMTCTLFDRREAPDIIDRFRENNVKNILALRGDKGESFVDTAEHYSYAYELIERIKSAGDFCVGGACYPEGHYESKSIDEDIFYLKIKVDSGCDFLITQLFFNNTVFYDYVEKMMKKDIKVPVLIGVMPVTKARQIERMVKLSGAAVPPMLQVLLDKYGDNDYDMVKAGIQYAVNQIEDLRANGFNYFHLYTMNNPDIAKDILRQLPIS